MDQPLILQQAIEPSITLLTFNRPDKRNALNINLLKTFSTILENLRKDSDQRAIILNGSGPVFCAGLDLNEAGQLDYEKESAALIGHVLSTLYHMPQVTIAAVHGAALAGGAGMACACDFVIAADGTRFGFPEVRRGLVAAQVSTLLRRQMNEKQLRELLLLGEIVNETKALELNLINRIVTSHNLLNEAKKIAREALKGAPGAIKETKRLIEELSPRSLAEDLAIAMKFHHAARISKEAQEGIKAFLEKRDPVWSK